MNLCQVAHSKNGMNAEHSCQIEKTISKSAAAVLGRGSAFHCIAFTPLAQKSGMTYPINTTNTAKSRIDTMLNIKPDFEILLRYPFLKGYDSENTGQNRIRLFPAQNPAVFLPSRVLSPGRRSRGVLGKAPISTGVFFFFRRGLTPPGGFFPPPSCRCGRW